MHPEDIKAEIRKRHGSLAAFEQARRLPPQSVSDLLFGKSRPAVAAAVANELNLDLDIVFPGQSARRRGARRSLIGDIPRKPGRRHRQNQPAASTGAGE